MFDVRLFNGEGTEKYITFITPMGQHSTSSLATNHNSFMPNALNCIYHNVFLGPYTGGPALMQTYNVGEPNV